MTVEPAAPAADAPAAAEPGAGPTLTPEDEALLREVEASLPAPSPSPPPAPPPPAAARGVTFFNNVYNPALSLNGLLLGWGAAPVGDQAAEGGLTIQEVELQLLANVDPYFSANFVLAIPGLEGLEIEEGYLTALPQPLGIGVRAGKMRMPFGRENPLHTHALPFVDRSLANLDLFGDEGLSEVGVEASWMAPVPWFAQLTLTGLDGANEALFGSPWGRDFAGLAGLRNMFDLSDDATLELGGTYLLGNNAARQLAQAAEVHLHFKWRPASDSRNSSASVLVEGTWADRPGGADPDVDPDALPLSTLGLRGEVLWQLTRGWFLGGRAEVLRQQYLSTAQVVGAGQVTTTRGSLILVLVPTEYSGFRAQVNVMQTPAFPMPVVEGFLQANFTIGTHPAHLY